MWCDRVVGSSTYTCGWLENSERRQAFACQSTFSLKTQFFDLSGQQRERISRQSHRSHWLPWPSSSPVSNLEIVCWCRRFWVLWLVTPNLQYQWRRRVFKCSCARGATFLQIRTPSSRLRAMRSACCNQCASTQCDWCFRSCIATQRAKICETVSDSVQLSGEAEAFFSGQQFEQEAGCLFRAQRSRQHHGFHLVSVWLITVIDNLHCVRIS